MLQCTPHFVDLQSEKVPHRSHPCSPVSREDRTPCIRDQGEPWGSLPLSVTGTRSNARAAAAACLAPLNHRMNHRTGWVGRDLKYHLVSTPLPTGLDCSMMCLKTILFSLSLLHREIDKVVLHHRTCR